MPEQFHKDRRLTWFGNPLLAAFIHVSSEMTFILNSARLLPPVSSAKKLVRGIFSQPSMVAQD